MHNPCYNIQSLKPNKPTRKLPLKQMRMKISKCPNKIKLNLNPWSKRKKRPSKFKLPSSLKVKPKMTKKVQIAKVNLKKSHISSYLL